MTPEQIVLIKTSFDDVLPIADTAAALFYGRLFELDPALRVLFKGDLQAQGHKLMVALNMIVQGLDRIETLVPAIQQLGARHQRYGVEDEDYATVATALLWTLERGLGDRFTQDVRAAWASAYTLLADTMRLAPVARA